MIQIDQCVRFDQDFHREVAEGVCEPPGVNLGHSWSTWTFVSRALSPKRENTFLEALFSNDFALVEISGARSARQENNFFVTKKYGIRAFQRTKNQLHISKTRYLSKIVARLQI